MYLHYQKDDRRTFVAATGDKTISSSTGDLHLQKVDMKQRERINRSRKKVRLPAASFPVAHPTTAVMRKGENSPRNAVGGRQIFILQQVLKNLLEEKQWHLCCILKMQHLMKNLLEMV
jgi:hypothetical protein